jgi:hypothetical protein
MASEFSPGTDTKLLVEGHQNYQWWPSRAPGSSREIKILVREGAWSEYLLPHHLIGIRVQSRHGSRHGS